jgi:hypothetical protein
MGYTAGTYQLRIDTGDSINTNSANIAKEVTDIGQSMDKYKSEINFISDSRWTSTNQKLTLLLVVARLGSL